MTPDTSLSLVSRWTGLLQQDALQQPWAHAVLAVLVLFTAAWVANWVTKRVVSRVVLRALGNLPLQADMQRVRGIVARLSNIIPALVIQLGIGTVSGLSAGLITVVRSVTAAFVILTIAMAVTSLLTLLSGHYQRRPDAANRPIKGYVQLANLVIYVVATLLIIAALMNRSPVLLLSGLGAMAAVLMLVFKDTILSLVASVQIGSNDMLRVGDWIEMPQLNADGDVIDIALHTVKVQNWDKTISTIPTHRFISDAFRNWRGMSESGGRRIKRALMIDQRSVRFLTDEDMARLSRFGLLRPYLQEKQEEIARWNAVHAADGSLDARRLTNIGTFRAYVLAYLKASPDIAQDMSLMVRQLAPGEHGLPLEIYAFASNTAWVAYEGIQGDLFDHLIAILPEFGLRLFQAPSGHELARLAPADD